MCITSVWELRLSAGQGLAQGCPIHEPEGRERIQPSFHISCPCVCHWVQADGQLATEGAMFSQVFWFSFSKNSNPMCHPLKTSRGDNLWRDSDTYSRSCIPSSVKGKKVDTDVFPHRGPATLSLGVHGTGSMRALNLGFQVSWGFWSPAVLLTWNRYPQISNILSWGNSQSIHHASFLIRKETGNGHPTLEQDAVDTNKLLVSKPYG